jgi:hypothetical protein
MILALASPYDPRSFRIYGGDDGARTRDLCRDSELEIRNLLETGVADGSFSALRHPREPLLNPYRTHDLCLKAEVVGSLAILCGDSYRLSPHVPRR